MKALVDMRYGRLSRAMCLASDATAGLGLGLHECRPTVAGGNICIDPEASTADSGELLSMSSVLLL